MINLSYHALERGGNVACVINAANEIAVAAFLAGRISFLDIRKIVEKSLEKMPYIKSPAYDDSVNPLMFMPNLNGIGDLMTAT